MKAYVAVRTAIVLYTCMYSSMVSSQRPEFCDRALCADSSSMCDGDYAIPPNECCARCFPKGQAPVSTAPVIAGSCPPLGPSPPNPFCVNSCIPNQPCSGDRLCCPDHCGYLCKTPIDTGNEPSQVATGQILSCPTPTGFPPHCYNLCGLYRPCFGNQLCCSNGCGRQCMIPVATPGSGLVTGQTQPPAPTPAPVPAPTCVDRFGNRYTEGQTTGCYLNTYRQVCRNRVLVWEPLTCQPFCPPNSCCSTCVFGRK